LECCDSSRLLLEKWIYQNPIFPVRDLDIKSAAASKCITISINFPLSFLDYVNFLLKFFLQELLLEKEDQLSIFSSASSPA